MKLIVQIPCHNEEEVLPITLRDLPDEVPGIDRIETLVVDDGSTDGTRDVARRLVDHLVVLRRRRGLTTAYSHGLRRALAEGADVIVNTDADNQYRAADIPALVEPVLREEADIVVGARPISDIDRFPRHVKWLQRVGSWITRKISGTEVDDATSGFRAVSRDAAKRLRFFSQFSYTLEMLIQAGEKGMAVASVPVRVNPEQRPSRLVTSTLDYVRRQVLTLVRIFVVYRPFLTFAGLGFVLFGAGFLLGARFLYFYFTGEGSGHVQSVILSSLLIGSGVGLGITGFVTDLIASNRKLLEDLQWEVQELRLREIGEEESEPERDTTRASGRL